MGLISDFDDAFSNLTLEDAFRISCISVSIIAAINFASKLVDDFKEGKSFEYVQDEYGNIETTGEIKSSVLKDCYLVERRSFNGELGLCVVNAEGIDILTNEFVTSIHEVEGCLISLDEDVYSVAKMSDYYDTSDNKLLSPDDIRDILLAIAENFAWHDYKALSYTY